MADKKPKTAEQLRQERLREFAREYVANNFNGTAACQKTFHSKGPAAGVQATRLLKDDNVRRMIDEEIQARAERTEIRSDEVLRRIYHKAVADAGKIMQLRRVCCRYCYGENHLYQFTPAEWERVENEHDDDVYKAQVDGKPSPPAPRPQGGVGYDKRKDPHPDCPECFGEGAADIHLADTRELSPVERELFAGIKTTKEGIEVKMHSQDKNLELLARHLGLIKDKVDHGVDESNPLFSLLQQISGSTLRPTEDPDE